MFNNRRIECPFNMCKNTQFLSGCVFNFTKYKYIKFLGLFYKFHKWLYISKKNQHLKLKESSEKQIAAFIATKPHNYLDMLVKNNKIVALTPLWDSPPITYNVNDIIHEHKD